MTWTDITDMTTSNSTEARSFEIVTKILVGDNDMNVNNPTVTSLLGYNNNIQIGDMVCIIYATLYTSKKNQADENKTFEREKACMTKKFKKKLIKERTMVKMKILHIQWHYVCFFVG